MKKIVISVIAILVCVVSVLLYNSYTDRKSQSEILEGVSNQIIQLNAKKAKVQQEIDTLEYERDEELRRGNYMVFFFDNMEENLYSDVYPLMTSYGHKGTIVMKNSVIPGDEMAISREHFDFLINAGWDTAIGYDNSIDMADSDALERFSEYLDGYIARLRENNIEVPITFCFDKGTYNEECEDILSERGFKIVRHFGEIGETYAGAIGNEIYYVGSGWYCAAATSLESAVVSAYEKNMTYSVSTGKILEEVTDSRNDCTKAKYRRMLDYMEIYCQGMEMCTVTELYEIKLNQLSTLSTDVGEYNAQIKAKEEELQNIQTQIDDIYNSIG